jgi:hypothetical protein
MKKLKELYFLWKTQRRFNAVGRRMEESKKRKIVDWDKLNKFRIM